jgi:hypothetical protein
MQQHIHSTIASIRRTKGTVRREREREREREAEKRGFKGGWMESSNLEKCHPIT